MRRLLILLALPVAGCMLRAHSGAAGFNGNWILERAVNVDAPDEFRSQIAAGAKRITIRSHWKEFANGQQPLTLIGVMTPEIALDTLGEETATQVGPFVMRHKSRRDGERLVTQWWTSEYMGASFQGTWTRTLADDGQRMTLAIDASNGAKESHAQLVFRRE